ncbi:hypothetical protein ACWO4B_001324 [Clostridium sporogenes]
MELNELKPKRNVVAKIYPKLCINCGKCRRSRPTEFIHELQRLIYRQYPDCDEINIMFHYEAGEGIKLSIENNNTEIVYL